MVKPAAPSPSSSSGEEVAPPPDLQPTDTWEDSDEDSGDTRKQGVSASTDGETNKPSPPCGPSEEVAKACSALDSFLSSWVTWSSDAFLTDRALKLLQWSLWLSSRLASPDSYCRSRSPRLRRLGKRMNPEMSTGLRAMYIHLSMARYGLRLNGLPMSLEAVRTGSWGAGWDGDPRIDRLGKVMAWSMVFCCPLEHVAYARWVAPNWIKADAERYSALSCRFWTAYIVADWASSVLKLKELGRRRGALEAERGGGTLTDEELMEKRKEIDKAAKHQWLHIARCAFFMLPAINWSLPKWERDPWLPENVVNGLMFAESVTCFYQSVCAMRK